jgi:hypothetical protein
MSEPPIARAASKVLSEEPIDLGAASHAERQRMVLAIKEEIERSARGRSRRVWVGRLLAAAMVLVAVAGTWRLATHIREPQVAMGNGAPPAVSVLSPVDPAASAISSLPSAAPLPTVLVAESVHGAVNVVSDKGRVPLAPMQQLPGGGTIIAEQGDATIAFASGSRVQMESATEASMSEDIGVQTVALRLGVVTATVAKLGDRARFVVRTDEAVVEAHGTMFRVARRKTPGCGLQTAVHLTEGRISVRDAAGERFLTAGEEWTSACRNDAPSTAIPSAGRHVLPAPAASQPSASSELTAQNALFSRAMAQKSSGDQHGAVATLDELLASYPTTPLREVACAQRMNLAAKSDPARAGALARAYVAEFPHGFARKDADSILAVP